MHYNSLLGALERDYAFWMVVVIILAVVLFVTFWSTRKRRVVWRQFARQWGLRYSLKVMRPHVSGRIDGKEFELTLSPRSSDQGLFGIGEVVMRLAIDTGTDCEFDITNEGVIMTAVREAVGDDDIEHLNRDLFDRKTCLHTSQADAVKEYLTQSRRDAILSLIDNCPSCNVHVTQDAIRVRQRSTVKSLQSLNDRLDAMTTASRQLEQRSG